MWVWEMYEGKLCALEHLDTNLKEIDRDTEKIKLICSHNWCDAVSAAAINGQ